ncbi:hypothetical protein [uncultured Tateyamaria sp.]|uniref:hypothetical protein n=1 Tax=uncultured Tateyamaria sp. TaxID=455651 RepID=UPI0026117398|nr:hypothetical protein [uncultured Tateyamaria sp.]
MSDASGKTSLFLERRSYRRRRMMDALRLLPVVGVLLWILPVFWPSANDAAGAPPPVAMSGAVTYVFVVWAGLILSGMGLWLALADPNGRIHKDPVSERDP